MHQKLFCSLGSAQATNDSAVCAVCNLAIQQVHGYVDGKQEAEGMTNRGRSNKR